MALVVSGGAGDVRPIGLGVACLLVPLAAWSQDATALVVLVAPPVLIAPVLTAVIRQRWLLRSIDPVPALGRLLALGALEFLLWLFAAGLAAQVYFQERWGAAVLLCAGIALILVTVRRIGAPHRSWSFTLAMFAVFPVVWIVVQGIWTLLFMSTA